MSHPAPAEVLLLPCGSYDRQELKHCLGLVLDHFSAQLPLSGAKVLLKPNMVKALSRESCGQTDPEFIAVLLDLGLERGWKMSVGDSPAIGAIEQVAQANGLKEVLASRNIPLVALSGNVTSTLNGRTVDLAKQLQGFNAVINLPKLKGHGQLYYTGAIKNLFGCIAGKYKVWHHMKLGDREGGRLFAEMLVDHAQAVAPCLNIMDGVRVMAGRGPIHGEAVSEGLIAASAQTIALDAAVFEHLGGEVDQDPVMTYLKTNFPEQLAFSFIEPLGKPLRGQFYFPKVSQRKPISFHPWVLIRMCWRNALSKWSLVLAPK